MADSCVLDLERALTKAWDGAVSGTYSQTDEKTFKQAFITGWYAGRNDLRLQTETTNATNCQDDCHYTEEKGR